MIKQESIYDKTTFEIIDYKEYHNGILVACDINRPNGDPIYHFREDENNTFWFEYVYKNNELVSFWNSRGDYIEYDRKGSIKLMGTIKLNSNLNDKARNNIR